MLPRHLDPVRIARLAVTEIRRTPKLLQCKRDSLLGAIMAASQMGLEIGVNGQCWLVPFKGEATLIMGYRGMIDLGWRSDKIRRIDARAVYEKEDFSFVYGLHPELHHTPLPPKDRGALTHAYAIIETTTGGLMFQVMFRDEIDDVRSAAKTDKIWAAHYVEMAKKTVLRRSFKLAPCSTDLQQAVSLDEQAEIGISQGLGDAIDVPHVSTQSDDAPTEAQANG
jgi:recombination protein RecT